MEKPGQRPKALKDNRLIIDQPSLQSLWQEYSYAFCTFIVWVAWIYLWLPLISLVAWLLGIRFYYEHMIVLGGYLGFLKVMGLYALIIFILGIALVFWALVNQIRFRGKDRRKTVYATKEEEVINFFGISRDDLRIAQKAKRLTISFNGEGKSLHIRQEE
ncbi:MAG: poly-beta-1,6-N-acetyl-D-glucosamine biosynthesis protein PgaD [bacterium]